MRLRQTFGVLSVLICVGSAALAADAKPKITFDDHILPLFRDKCIGCHNPDKSKGGLVLSNFTRVMAGGSSGEIVKAGDPAGSRLLLLMSHKSEPHMPPKSDKLPDASLALVQQWIEGGLLENSGSKAKSAVKPTTEIGLKAIVKGKPAGPPPMPEKPLALDPVVRTARTNALTALAASPWAPLVAVGGQKQIVLYNSDTLDYLGVFPFPEGTPHVLKFSRNGSLLLAGGGHDGKSGKVVIFSVKTGERIIAVGDESDAVLAADISADQTLIALGGPSKMIRLYSTKDGVLVREIKKHTDWITAMEFSPDGVLLATGDRNGGLQVWEAFTGREYFSLRGHTASITDVSWRLDSNMLVSASEDTTLRLWEMENGNAVKTWGAHGGGTSSVKYTHDGRIASCGRDRVAKTWDGNDNAQRTFETQPDIALRVAFSHDGKNVITGDWTGQIGVYQAADGKRLGLLTANPPTVAERIQEGTKQIASRQALRDQTKAALSASQAAIAKSQTDLAAAQKNAAESVNAVKAANATLAKTKAAADQALAALSALQSSHLAKDVLAKSLVEAAAKVKEAAAKAPANKDLAAASAKAAEIANQAAGEATAVAKALADQTPIAKAAAEAAAKAQQTASTAQAAAANAVKQVEAITNKVKAVAAKMQADQAAAAQAATSFEEARKSLEKWQAVVAAKPAGK